MTEDDYHAFFKRLLAKHGGSFDSPSGWGETALYFSCHRPPIEIPFADKATPDQRKAIVARAKKRYGID